MKNIACLLLSIAFCSCGAFAPPPQRATQTTPELQQSFDQAEAAYQKNQLDEAQSLFSAFIKDNTYNTLTDSSYVRLGDIAARKQNCAGAREYYDRAIKGTYSPSVTPKARAKATKCAYEMKDFAGAISYMTPVQRDLLPLDIRAEADAMAFESARSLGSSPVMFALFLLDHYDAGAKTAMIGRDAAFGVVDSWMKDNAVTSNSVKKLPLEQYKGKTSGGYAYYKLADALQREGKGDESKDILKNYVMAYGKHPYHSFAEGMLSEVGGDVKAKVGIILPLSGKFENYGRSVLNGIECAAGVYPPCSGPDGLQLIIRDADETPELAAQAVHDLVGEGALAIIGPMRSASAPAAISAADSEKIPMITLSQNEGVAASSQYALRNSISTEDEIKSLTDWLGTQSRIRNIFVFYPNTKMGMSYKDIFVAHAKNAGKRIIGQQSYAPHQMEFMGGLRGLYEGKLVPDAIFIPDSYVTAAYIAAVIGTSSQNVPKLLGVSRWHTQAFITKGGEYVEGAVFPTSFDQQAPNARAFVQSFKEAYGKNATLLEALGYDSLKLIIQALRTGAMSKQTLAAAIKNITNLPGATGDLTPTTGGEIKRKYRLLMIKRGDFVPIE